MAVVVLFQFCGFVVLSCSWSWGRRVGRLRGCFALAVFGCGGSVCVLVPCSNNNIT